MITFIETIGLRTIRTVHSLSDTLLYSYQLLAALFDRKTYNSATLSILTLQIYFTAVELLPFFLITSVILGTLLIGIVFQIIKDMGLDQYLGNILIGFIMTELSPFVTVLLIALRSSSAINTEIAVMKVNKELKSLKLFGIDEISYLFLPRIVNGVISIVLLNGLFSIVLLGSGLLFSNLIFGMGLNVYSNLLVNSIRFYDIAIIFIKCSTFGFFVTLIPVVYGRKASYELTSIPIAVLHGMIRVFIAILAIEVLSLIARFI